MMYRLGRSYGRGWRSRSRIYDAYPYIHYWVTMSKDPRTMFYSLISASIPWPDGICVPESNVLKGSE